ncbi:UPF0690 protein C1orf52 homolog isoform X1 [Synchiropus splendidus]|uniref:UPF0690 protein C1orf52 homolog isoform X1 n=1 Tax=Synchiropus splendidus TaxID=270530 RepID=UPI00237D9297|nr:UPF0690 protein C1orf52 homolog isoform X1 [Synchiropus splendidus]
MADEAKSGALGFFSSYDDLSDSSDSDGEAERPKETSPKPATQAADSGDQTSQSAGTKRATGGAPLPKPDELFNTVSKPAFLYNPLNKQIDWDRLAVKPPEEIPRDFAPWQTAVPPPQSYTAEPTMRKRGPPPGQDMAIKWSSVYEDNGEDAPGRAGKAKFLPEEEQQLLDSEEEPNKASDMSAKKRRVETFQQKEKRKRDLGQATSDKNFVEEEKRILRQKLE